MNVKKRKSAAGKTNKANGTNGVVKIDFKPELNGNYRIKFPPEHSGAGFAVLLKGGMFHRFPDGFVVTKRHRELLDDENVPYDLIED